MNPDVILYDEPTAGLDPYNSKNFRNDFEFKKRESHRFL